MTLAQRQALETMVATTEAMPGVPGALVAAEALRAALADCEAVRAVASKALDKTDAGGDEAHLVGLVVARMREAEYERAAIRDENAALRERIGVLTAAEHEAYAARVVVDRQRHVALAENDALRAEINRLNAEAFAEEHACRAGSALERDALIKAVLEREGTLDDALSEAKRLRAEVADLRSRVAHYKRLLGDGGKAEARLLDIKRTLDATLSKETPEESNG